MLSHRGETEFCFRFLDWLAFSLSPHVMTDILFFWQDKQDAKPHKILAEMHIYIAGIKVKVRVLKYYVIQKLFQRLYLALILTHSADTFLFKFICVSFKHPKWLQITGVDLKLVYAPGLIRLNTVALYHQPHNLVFVIKIYLFSCWEFLNIWVSGETPDRQLLSCLCQPMCHPQSFHLKPQI